MGVDHPAELFDFDRRMRDDVQKLPVRPDVVFARGDVKIADEHRFRTRPEIGKPARHLVEEIELVGELVVDLRVRFVAAGRHVEIMDAHAAGQARGDVAAVALLAEAALFDILERQFRNDGDAVIAGLTRHRVVFVTCGADRLEREIVLEAFDLLEAEDVRRFLLQESRDEINP